MPGLIDRSLHAPGCGYRLDESATGWVMGTTSSKNEGRKDDVAKLRYDLLPARALRDVAAVMTHGAGKYGDENWKMVPELERRYLAAAMRHIEQMRCGERLDAGAGGSGFPHLAHAICSLLFVLEWWHMQQDEGKHESSNSTAGSSIG